MTETYKVRPNAWHYKFIEWSEKNDDNIMHMRDMGTFNNKEHQENLSNYLPPDFCRYWRRFSYGVVKILTSTAMIAFSAVLLFKSSWAGIGSVMMIGGAGIFFAVVITGVFGGLVWLFATSKEKIYNTPVEQSFIKTKYQSFKSKYCPMIELVESDAEKESN